jgi:hypothetical protein
MKKETTFQIGIKKIKDLAFSVDESIDPGKEIGLKMKHSLQFNKSDSTIELVLEISFLKKSDDKIFMSSRTGNIFSIPDLDKFESEDTPQTYNIPDAMLTTIVSLSFTHSRALIARNAEGTKFSDIFLPIIDPKSLAEKFFKSSNH